MRWRAAIAILACALSISGAQALSYHHFIVFFGYAKCALDERARIEIVDYISAYSFDADRTAEVRAHADTAEEGAKLEMSKCRGNAVGQAMVDLGYPRDRIRLCDFGAEDLRVQTLANVKEPENRRVEIWPSWIGAPESQRCMAL